MPLLADRDAGMARLIWDEEKVMERRHYLVHRDLMTMLEKKWRKTCGREKRSRKHSDHNLNSMTARTRRSRGP